MTKGVELMIKKRKELGLTQNQLADNVIVISRNGIALIETGRSKPSVISAKAIGDYLGFDWTLFIEEE